VKTLVLVKETVRNLNNDELKSAQGGKTNSCKCITEPMYTVSCPAVPGTA